MAKVLAEPELRARLEALPGWSLREGRLYRQFRFADFSEAFAFMAKMAVFSERKNHHPEWKNVYNRVEVELFTHDSGGITELDLEWAAVASAAYQKFTS